MRDKRRGVRAELLNADWQMCQISKLMGSQKSNAVANSCLSSWLNTEHRHFPCTVC